ncbi:type II toxin-antitoxin system RelE/ParE family toxin [Iodobacter sp. LRB]|uniref:type II toxin-antitoxin system RelE/ParE family toxin n=1 Tax=unclassified Iodobacter TaxID=235634 RepID=UPI000C1079CC|nr:type II toxin-antitoxin system RelE/ParE family toxin [Iodobacter sp. BJB302]PHV02337.1 plasmid stabilization protein [Iodobacter sp. BJB302]
MRLRWLRKAIANLDAEAEYIAQENPRAAAEMFAYVKAKVEDLAHFPASGRPGRVPSTRELIIDRYPLLVPYRVVGNELHVLRVFHTRRKPPLSW